MENKIRGISIDEIKKRLQLPLPGEKAHFPLSSMGRRESSDILKTNKNYRDSAVAVVFYKNKHQLNLILTQRNEYNGVHSGQICFPGGKKEDFDIDLHRTAIRESTEEIGLQDQHFQQLGELTPVYIPVSQFKIQPYVFYYSKPPIFYPNNREVALVLTFPLEHLFQKNIIKTTNINLVNGQVLYDIPYFNIDNQVVWGATALILNEFRSLFI